ncbi:MAG: hypothetical protein AB7S26_32035 [Sandaracinaceae bacterium]
MSRHVRLALLLVVVPSSLGAACTAGGAPPCRACDVDAGPTVDDAGSPPSFGLTIRPSVFELAVDGPTPPTLQLRAFSSDGTTEQEVFPRWEADHPLVARVDEITGVVTATGLAGGEVTVTATSGSRTAIARITVQVRRRSTGDGVSDGDATSLDLAPLASVPVPTRIAYPLDGAVMPQNVLPPDIQWQEGELGELVRVVLRTEHVRVEHTMREVDASFGRAWTVAADDWLVLARSDAGASIAIVVERLHEGARHVSAPVLVRLARGALPGSAYYWSIADGSIQRIDDAGGREDVIPHPPAVPGERERCVGCHTISPSGRWMAASMGGGRANGVRCGAVFDLTSDLGGDPAPTTFSTAAGYDGPSWTQGSWSPDETRLIVERDLHLALLDPFSGRDVGLAGGAWPAGNALQPDWSPDGESIAYVVGNSWTVDFTAGDLAVLDVVGPDAIGEARVIHRGASLAGAPEGGVADSYPSFAPDARRIAFAHGTGSYSAGRDGALYLVAPDGADLVRLDRASGDGHDSFAPRFAPVISGGYYWLAFHSHRDFGNDRSGRRGELERERIHGVWIAAVRVDAAPGEDPSEVPYFLPGQDPRTSNVSVAWTMRACRENGIDCALGTECCSGECAVAASGAGTCAPPPPDRCRERGQTCADAGCCAGLTCFEHVCVDDLY